MVLQPQHIAPFGDGNERNAKLTFWIRITLWGLLNLQFVLWFVITSTHWWFTGSFWLETLWPLLGLGGKQTHVFCYSTLPSIILWRTITDCVFVIMIIKIYNLTLHIISKHSSWGFITFCIPFYWPYVFSQHFCVWK